MNAKRRKIGATHVLVASMWFLSHLRYSYSFIVVNQKVNQIKYASVYELPTSLKIFPWLQFKLFNWLLFAERETFATLQMQQS